MEEEIFYKLLKEEGPDHNKTFYSAVLIGEDVYGKGSGRTKKAAEQQAAYHAILNIRDRK